MAAVRMGASREHAQPGSLLLVVHDFLARSDDELSLAKGDRIELIERDDDFGDGWFLGRHMGTGNTGLFPEVYTTPAPKGTLQQSQATRRVSDARQSNGFVDRSAPTTPAMQQRPSSGIVQSQNTLSMAQASLRSSLPNTTTNSPRAPPLNADSPVMHETLSVIDEHITDLNGSRAIGTNREDARHSRSSAYSSHLMNRFPYIPGHETDEDENQAHTEAEVMTWTPGQVAEYLEDNGVEKLHCDVFRDQEISGEVLLAMDQSSLFIKEFQLGPVGRRLKLWHKIKALQDEVKNVGAAIQPIRSASQYSDGAAELAQDGSRNRSSTVGAAVPRALESSHMRQGSDASRSGSAGGLVVNNNSARQSTPTGQSRPESTYRPSAHSIRTMNSRRHSSVDSTPESVGRSAHRQQPSTDPTWQASQMARNSHRHAPSADAIADAPARESPYRDSLAPAETEKGYFSSTEVEARAHPKRASVLRKTPPLGSFANTPLSGKGSQPSSTQQTPVSPTFAEASSASASTTSVNHWSNAVGSLSSKISTIRSVTSPLSKPMNTPQDVSNPVVTKLEPTAGTETKTDAQKTSPVASALGFLGSQRAKRFGLRTTSEAVTKDEKSTLPSLRDDGSGAVKEAMSSPARTGSTTPSTETRSLDIEKSDMNSRASTGSGSRLVPPLPATSRRVRYKTKKATSAYTRGLESKSPADAIADCDYSGWMKKKSGSLMTTWKSRLFILKGRRLSYYYSNDDTEEKGLIDISFHRVLPAHHETLTGVHAAVTGVGRTAPSPKDTPSKTMAQRDLEERPPIIGEDENVFIFKLVPPKVGLSKAVNFTKPTVHYFAVSSRQEGRLWMAALMKATIDRDEDAAVTTTYNQKTISLAKARARRERPPALREEDPLQTPSEFGGSFVDLGLGIDGLSEKTGISQEPTPHESPKLMGGGIRMLPKTFAFDDEASSMAPSTVDRSELGNGGSIFEKEKEALPA